jgi:hypothetical protein
MTLLALSDDHHHRLKRFRLKTWKAIALCAGLRLVDTAFGFGFVEPAPSLAAQEIPSGTLVQECNP